MSYKNAQSFYCTMKKYVICLKINFNAIHIEIQEENIGQQCILEQNEFCLINQQELPPLFRIKCLLKINHSVVVENIIATFEIV